MSFYHSNWIVDVLFIMVGFYTSYVLSGLLCNINLTESFYIDMHLTAEIRKKVENERLGLVADLTDTWTPEQREMFLLDWNNDEPLLEMMANEDFIRAFEDNIHQDEPLLQVGGITLLTT